MNDEQETSRAFARSLSNVGLVACDLQRELCEWASSVNILSANHVAKVRDELEELEKAEDDAMEMADVLLALMLHAEQNGVDLLRVGRQKLEIIKSRAYGEPDERGVVRHIDTPNA